MQAQSVHVQSVQAQAQTVHAHTEVVVPWLCQAFNCCMTSDTETNCVVEGSAVAQFSNAFISLFIFFILHFIHKKSHVPILALVFQPTLVLAVIKCSNVLIFGAYRLSWQTHSLYVPFCPMRDSNNKHKTNFFSNTIIY